jgi:hypothetical protein
MLGRTDANRFFLVVETQKGPSMRYVDSIFGSLLKPIDRRWFQAVVDRYDADAYDKTFTSWDHLVTLVFAQLSSVDNLRGLETAFNANAQAHYQLGVEEIARSTVSDANARRPIAPFAELFAKLAAVADRATRREGAAMVKLIDSSPIPLGKLCQWAKWNGRIRGMKLHVVYDPQADVPRAVEVTPANVNDVEVGRRSVIEPATTYVFDKGYCHFGWWKKINDDRAFFVTRAKVNMRLRAIGSHAGAAIAGDGCTIIDDAEVVLASQGNARLPIQRSLAHRRRDRRALQEPLANRTPVPLDQAASAHPQIPRQECKRHPPAGPRRHDRLSVAAHGCAHPPHPAAGTAAGRTPQSTSVHAPTARRNRQTTPLQPKPPTALPLSRPTGILLRLIFPGQPCAEAGIQCRRNKLTLYHPGSPPSRGRAEMQSG